MVHFGEFLKTWSLRSNSVTRQVSFYRTKIGGKCQNSKIQMRHFEWFSNTVLVNQSWTLPIGQVLFHAIHSSAVINHDQDDRKQSQEKYGQDNGNGAWVAHANCILIQGSGTSQIQESLSTSTVAIFFADAAFDMVADHLVIGADAGVWTVDGIGMTGAIHVTKGTM